MMIIDFVFEQMLRRFDGAMGFHCNSDDKKKTLLARNSLMTDSGLKVGPSRSLFLSSELTRFIF